MMLLKTFLGIVFVFLHANITPVEGVNSELTQEEQKKLMDTLDYDRKEIGHQLKIPFEDIKYDLDQEIAASNQKVCDDLMVDLYRVSVPLKWNDVMDDLIKAMGSKLSEELSRHSEKPITIDFLKLMDMYLFNPALTKVGCSKTIKCSKKLPENYEYPEVAGKTIEAEGMCVLNERFGIFKHFDKLSSVKIPSISKYAALIGLGGEGANSSGSVFNMILAALFLIFYV